MPSTSDLLPPAGLPFSNPPSSFVISPEAPRHSLYFSYPSIRICKKPEVQVPNGLVFLFADQTCALPVRGPDDAHSPCLSMRSAKTGILRPCLCVGRARSPLRIRRA